MCSPLALAGIGAAAGAYGAYKGQESENTAREYQARLAQHNAMMAEIQAKSIEEEGRAQEGKLREGVRQLKGAQRAGFGASGVVVGEGSALQTVQDTAALGEVDALTLRYNTARAAQMTRLQGSSYTAEASMLRAGKGSPLLAGGLSLISSGGAIGGSLLARSPGTIDTKAVKVGDK